MNLKQAIALAQFLATVVADVSDTACVCTLGPCREGVRWEVVADGVRIGVGIVTTAEGAIEEEPAPARPVREGSN